MIGEVVADLDEPVSSMYQYFPSGFYHTHNIKGTVVNCTLQIHTSNINHARHMNMVDPCKVLIIGTNNT